MRLTVTLALMALIAFGGPARALTLAFPDPATPTASNDARLGSYRLPIGPFDGQQIPTRLAEGAVAAQAWRIEGADQTTLALMRAMRAQVEAQGFKVIYECEAQACGGFDFRFGTEVLPEPAMHVDLGDFRYLAAEKGDEVASLVVSRSASAGFVQLTRVTAARSDLPRLQIEGDAVVPLPAGEGEADDTAPPGSGDEDEGETARGLGPLPDAPPTPGSLVARLEAEGSASLDDLRFSAGATELEQGDYPSLAALAGWLRAAPGRKVALVGHTDASGGLEINIVISRRRAEQVRAVLLGQYGVPRAQVIAEGVGFLSPRAPNATDAGREANRRVEVVVMDAE